MLTIPSLPGFQKDMSERYVSNISGLLGTEEVAQIQDFQG